MGKPITKCTKEWKKISGLVTHQVNRQQRASCLKAWRNWATGKSLPWSKCTLDISLLAVHKRQKAWFETSRFLLHMLWNVWVSVALICPSIFSSQIQSRCETGIRGMGQSGFSFSCWKFTPTQHECNKFLYANEWLWLPHLPVVIY